jgi:hypothetical protein
MARRIVRFYVLLATIAAAQVIATSMVAGDSEATGKAALDYVP